MLTKSRLDYFDYAKAFAIFSVVLVHIGFPGNSNYQLFIIPLFFMAVGYNTYVPSKRTSKESLVGRFKTVLLPFWGFMLLYLLVELIRAPYIGYGDMRLVIPGLVNVIYGSGNIPNNSGIFDGIRELQYYVDPSSLAANLIMPTNPHLWFLPALFMACVIFYFIMEKAKKSRLSHALMVVILVFLASLEVIIPQIKQLPYGLGRGFIGTAFMLVGFWMRKYEIFDRGKNFAIPVAGVSFFLAAMSMLLGSNGSSYVNSYYGEYGVFSVFMTFLGGAGAACFVLYLCRLIELLPLPKIKSTLSLIGRNTMSIYCWHMLYKFIFDVLYLKIFDTPPCPDQFFMSLLPLSAWWYMLLEAVAIIFVCIFMVKLKAKTRGRANRRLQSK